MYAITGIIGTSAAKWQVALSLEDNRSAPWCATRPKAEALYVQSLSTAQAGFRRGGSRRLDG